MARFWIGGSGNWSNTVHWSTTSGGTGGASVPTSSQDVRFDANSFTAASQKVTVDVAASCRNMDWTGATNNPTFDIHSNLNLGIYGSLTFISAMSISNTARSYNSINFYGTGTGKTITMAGQQWPSLWFNASFAFDDTGEWILQDDFICPGNNFTLILNNGVLRTNNKTVTVQEIDLYNTFGGLYLGSSTVNTTAWYADNSSILDTATSTINFNYNANGTFPFYGGNLAYYNVNLNPAVDLPIYGANSFNNLTLYSKPTSSITYTFPSTLTQTFNGALQIGNPNSTYKVKLRSDSPGTQYTLSKSSGVVVLNYADIQDSNATGGAHYYATNSTDSGDNTGWTFGTPVYTFAVSDSPVSSSVGALAFQKEVYSSGSDNTSFSLGSYLSTFQPLSQKDYEYRVFDRSGNFIGIWLDVTSDFSYQQAINQTPTQLSVDIARSPNNLVVKYDPLLDSNGASITDTNGNPIYLPTQTPNAVGAGTDVMENYNVDVYAFYGGYDTLLDTSGNPIQDTSGDNILVQFGFPSGKRVYSGYIVDYDLKFGSQTGVTVTIAPHSAETQQFAFMTVGGNTTVSYGTVDPVQMARDAMTSYATQGGTKITYSTASMPLSGQTASYDFKLQTVRESIDKCIDLLPSGYYQFVDPGENIQYLLNKGTTADHTFVYEKHLTDMNLRKSISQLINDVYFVGGDPGTGSPLYKHYSDATSIATYRRGLLRLSDSRVTLSTSAFALSNQQINQFKNPRYRTSITITDAVYDIENIKLGQMVGFQNFGNFVDALILQIVNISREKHQVTLDLDMIVPSDTKRLYELKKELQAEQVRDIAVAPA